MIPTLTLDCRALDDLTLDAILEVLDASQYCLEEIADVRIEMDWLDAIDHEWLLEVCGLRVGSRLLLWSRSHEGGRDDEELIVDDVHDDADVEEYVKDKAEELGRHLGEIKRLERTR